MATTDSLPEQRQFWRGLLIPLAFVALLWVIELLEYTSGTSLVRWGIEPRTLNGFIGILLAPLIHDDWQHLISNSLPLIILGFTIINGYPKVWLKAFGWIYGLTGFWVWVAARPSFHIGASGLIYGLAAFLFSMGVLRKDQRSMALALLVAFLYGGLIWGILPIQEGVSWESHLLGLVSGVFAAIMYYKVDYPVKKKLPDYDPTDIPHMPYWKYEVEGGVKPQFQQSTQPQVRIHYQYKPTVPTPPPASSADRPKAAPSTNPSEEQAPPNE